MIFSLSFSFKHCSVLIWISLKFVPKCLIEQLHKSQNAAVPYPTMLHSEQKWAHFCSEWSIVGYGTDVFWDLWIRSIENKSSLVQVMAGHCTGNKQLQKLMISQFFDTYINGSVKYCSISNALASVRENFDGIEGLRADKTFKTADPASLLQVFTVVNYGVFTKYCQSNRTCKYFILPVHPLI